MAILGMQAVMTLVMISVLEKICPIYSLGRWLLTGQKLVRYLHPSDEELKKAAGISSKPPVTRKGRKGNKELQNGAGDTFTVPRTIELTLSPSPLQTIDVLPLRYYSEFIWLIDFTLCTAIVVAVNYIHEHYIYPSAHEYGLSSIWCTLLAFFCVRPLVSFVTSFKLGKNSGEIVLCALFGFFFLITSMMLLIVDDRYLEFHIVPAHGNFTLSAKEFLAKQEITSIGPLSLVAFRTILAVISAFIGSLLTFPGLRLARVHMDALEYSKDRPLLQVLMHLDLLMPLFLLGLWVPAISRDVLVGRPLPGTAFTLTDEHYDLMRQLLIVVFAFGRMCLLRFRLQAYLNTVVVKTDGMRKESGRISNVELRSQISNVFYYLCVVIIQLIAPLILILSIQLLAISLSDSGEVVVPEPVSPDVSELAKSVTSQVRAFTVSLSELRSVFSAHLFSSMTSYCLWYMTFAWTTTAYFGLFYHSYTTR